MRWVEQLSVSQLCFTAFLVGFFLHMSNENLKQSESHLRLFLCLKVLVLMSK